MARLLTGAFALICLASVIISTASAEETTVKVDFKGSKLSGGYIDSESAGTNPNGSYVMPEGKLRINGTLTPDIKVITRMTLNNPNVLAMDYLYVDYTNFLSSIVAPSLKGSAFDPMLRVGLFKVDIGEETWGNNLVDAATGQPSATNTGAYDEGFQLSQVLPKDKLGIPVKWAVSFTNGNSGSGVDTTPAKALCIKVAANPINELYASLSHYNSGDLGTAAAAMSFAGLSARPTNSTQWTRTITELDLRYDIQPGKEKRLEPGMPVMSDSKAFFRLAYGQFKDDGKDTVTPIVSVTDREGSYYFVEGTYNPIPKVYLAARYSNVGFDKSTVYATLNSCNCNSYTRTTVCVGYRLTDNTHIKLDYTTNAEDVASGTAAYKNNQFGLLVTTTF
ncbi:MAG: hypothetical protein WC980_06210 [Candidatus Brocadiia bacterium]